MMIGTKGSCKRWRKQVIFFLCVLFLVPHILTAYADEPPPPPRPWQRDLGDGLVFHYRPEYDHYSEHRFMEGTPTEFREQGYPETGLYRDGKLVYRVEEPFWGTLYFSNDAMTFLEVEWWVPASGDPGIPVQYREPIWPAARFFVQGELAHSHEVLDLVRNSGRLVFTVGHVIWDYQNERIYDRENNTLQVTTRDRQIITFDLTTGEIVSKVTTTKSIIMVIIIILVILTTLFIAVWLWDKKVKKP